MYFETTLPDGMRTRTRVAAIGDIHGRLDALQAGLAAVENPAETEVVLLGDYVNRGPHSPEVLDHLRALEEAHPFRDLLILPGNHDHMLLDAARDPRGDAAADWDHNDNHLTILRAYPGWDRRHAMRDLADRMPEQVRKRLAGELPLYHKNGDLLFVHAGIHPQATPAQMFPERPTYPLLATWVRDEFLYRQGGHLGPDGEPVIVVHGHTRLPSRDPVRLLEMVVHGLTQHRIGLDVSHTESVLLMEAEGDALRVRVVTPAPSPEPSV